MEGKISWEEFLAFSNHLLDISNILVDGWALRGIKDVPGGAYLVKRETCEMLESQSALEDFEDAVLEQLLEDKSAAVAETSCSEKLTCEYHVLYSLSYEVPVLYFNIWKSDGSLLTLEQVWERVPRAHQMALNFAKWNTLTQQEHPIIKKPFFQLHPCRTSELLSKFQSGNRLLSWLSCVAPAAGLNIPLAYGNSELKSSYAPENPST